MYKDFEPLLKDLPEGWTSEPYWKGEVVLLEKKDQGFVSINTERRVFAIGKGQPVGAGTYCGRGWKQKILSDAMAALNRVWEGKQ
jgi:hypothetical protein